MPPEAWYQEALRSHHQTWHDYGVGEFVSSSDHVDPVLEAAGYPDVPCCGCDGESWSSACRCRDPPCQGDHVFSLTELLPVGDPLVTPPKHVTAAADGYRTPAAGPRPVGDVLSPVDARRCLTPPGYIDIVPTAYSPASPYIPRYDDSAPASPFDGTCIKPLPISIVFPEDSLKRFESSLSTGCHVTSWSNHVDAWTPSVYSSPGFSGSDEAGQTKYKKARRSRPSARESIPLARRKPYASSPNGAMATKGDRAKPEEHFVALIAKAILSNHGNKMLLSDIYRWIMAEYPYFETAPSPWKISVRHHLTVNNCFVKAGPCDKGRGNYWTIHAACLDDFRRGKFARPKPRRHSALRDWTQPRLMC